MSISRTILRTIQRRNNKLREMRFLSLSEEQENESELTDIEVHGYMIYECERCGQRVKMFLEKGLEDKIQDGVNPEKHKPVPFVIACNMCGSMMKHVDWHKDKYFGAYKLLPKGCSYFKNTKNSDCGVSVMA